MEGVGRVSLDRACLCHQPCRADNENQPGPGRLSDAHLSIWSLCAFPVEAL